MRCLDLRTRDTVSYHRFYEESIPIHSPWLVAHTEFARLLERRAQARAFLISFAILLFSILQSVYGQNNEPNPSHSGVEALYEVTINSVVWIPGRGSGVLIDTHLKLVITNAHVVGEASEVAVIFPVRDWNGQLIVERSFYTDAMHRSVLRQLGVITVGRIIARDMETDLALLELVGIPQTAHQVGHNYTLNFLDNLQQNDIVHVLGNPDSLDLWRWTAGIFQGFDERGLLRVAADTYEGHSGGPVLDGRGMLIGITTLSNRNTTTLAVSAHHIGDLLQTLKPRRILSIENPIGFPMYYTIKWTPDAIWEKLVIPPNKSRISWIEMVDIAAGYPKVVFDNIADDGEFTGQINNVETYVRNFGQGVVPKPRRGATYRFEYNSTTGEIRLRKLAGDG